MSNYQVSGLPRTINLDVGSEGACVRLRQWSSRLYFQADSPTTVYWTQADFDADKNGLLLSADQPRFPVHLSVSVANVWLRGRGSTSSVSITAVGQDG